jgi:predicted Zn-dependent peptidase
MRNTGHNLKKYLCLLTFLVLAAQPVAAVAAEPFGKRIVLENGMILLLSEKHDIPMVTVSMAIKAGNTAASADQPGIASLTASLLPSGLHGRPDQQRDRFYRWFALCLRR